MISRQTNGTDMNVTRIQIKSSQIQRPITGRGSNIDSCSKTVWSVAVCWNNVQKDGTALTAVKPTENRNRTETKSELIKKEKNQNKIEISLTPPPPESNHI